MDCVVEEAAKLCMGTTTSWAGIGQDEQRYAVVSHVADEIRAGHPLGLIYYFLLLTYSHTTFDKVV